MRLALALFGLLTALTLGAAPATAEVLAAPSLEPAPAWCTALECNPVYQVLKLLQCEVLPGTPLAGTDLGAYC